LGGSNSLVNQPAADGEPGHQAMASVPRRSRIAFRRSSEPEKYTDQCHQTEKNYQAGGKK
jgi:hypothetical protein